MRTLLSLILVGFVLSVQAQTTLSSEVKQEIKNRIEYGINPSIAVGIIDEGGTTYYTYGTKTVGGEEVNEHSIYEIGSITKTFTGVLLALAIENGKMKADDPAQNYLEGATIPTYNDVSVTLGHLSDHTSSIPRMPTNFTPSDPLNPYVDYTTELMYEFLNGLELTREIGSEYEYSNLAQGLLGHILAAQEGVSYEELLKQQILKPLKMSESTITFTEDMKSRLAQAHSNGREVKNWDIPALAGAGAIRSSVHDMIKYLEANMGLKKTKLLSSMELSHAARHDKANGMSVGLGWHIRPSEDGDIIWHNGGTGGYRAFSGFIKETKTGVVVLTNSTASVDDIGFNILSSDIAITKARKPITLVLRKKIDDEGVEAALAEFQRIKENERGEYNFSESAINMLGYQYIEDNLEAAKALFKLNMEEYPKSSNVYDSYAEALMKEGNNEQSIEYYKKSLELNPNNTNAIDMMKKMGVDYDAADHVVSEDVLESYVGKYALTPQFVITVTRDGSRIFAQATGQQQFEIFPISDIKFYLKVVEAQIQFNIEEGEVKSLTLFQAGQEVKGAKID